MAIFGMVVLCACATNQTDGLKKAGWLIGTWESKTPEGSIYETWTKINSTELLGKSYVVKGKDTIVFETISLVQEQQGLVYIPTVKDQNNGLPVRFINRYISGKELSFENLQHDFPQVISYQRIRADSCIAEVSGVQNGKISKRVFPMKRIN